MSYLVSARKYRPTKFDNVVGQKHVTTTLKNAIKNNKIGHAYLFCGPRGVGKTTCARIFASTVNENSNSQYNIFELDAASNNSGGICLKKPLKSKIANPRPKAI